ncbi:hypothetical protein AB1L07_20955 [Niallia alba]|uniref:hypothetical protein n=1 Tax=Niallia alba TaxID=2729105 RepID=UPI00399FE626
MDEPLEEKSHITYSISGITGVKLKGVTHVNLLDKNLESVYVNESLNKVTIFIKDEVDFHQALKECERLIYQLLLSLILHKDAIVDIPQYNEEEKNQKSENGDIITISSGISIKSSLSITSIYDGEEFLEEMLNDRGMINPNNELLYRRLYSIMKNPDQVTKYLALYEFLLDLVSKGKPKKEQKNVTEFIKFKGFDKGMNSIPYHTTRRKNMNFKEDTFTYYRNEIAHAEFENNFSKYEGLAGNINSKLINRLIEVINCAIRHEV